MAHVTIEAAIIVYIICYLVGLLVTSYLFYIASNFTKAISLFMMLYLLQFLGAILIYNRAIVGLFFSIVVANFLVLLGTIMILYVIADFTKQKVQKWFVIGIIVFYFLYTPYFTYAVFDTDARIILHNVTHISVLFYAFYMIQQWHKSHSKFKEILSSIIFVAIINYVIRIIINVFASDYGNDLLNYDQGAIPIILSAIINLTMIAGVLSFMNSLTGSELFESERSKLALLQNVPGFAYRCLNDENWTMEFLSDGFEQLTGYSIDEVIKNKSLSFEDIIHPDSREDVRIAWERAIQNKTNCIVEYQIVQKDGSVIWIWEQGVGIYNEDGECIHLEGYIVNIDTRKQMEQNLRVLSYRDHLTGLYNRRYIEEAFNRMQSSRNLPITIIVIDMNGLKFINDSFGHDQGDIAIQYVATTLRNSLRNYELVARLSGDEFMILLEQASGDVAELILQRIYDKLNEFDGNYRISISAGYSSKTTAQESLLDIRKDAENKMYKAKMYDKPSNRRKAVNTVLQVLFEKDNISEGHAKSVSELSKQLAAAAGLPIAEVNKVETAALLHDVGKITIDKTILLSKSKLSKEEYDIMKQHPSTGYRIINNVPELTDIAEIILYHHERMDGKGYPAGLVGNDIPYVSRIISICDAYDSMVNERYYRQPKTKEEAIKELKTYSGTQFDSELVHLFCQLME